MTGRRVRRVVPEITSCAWCGHVMEKTSRSRYCSLSCSMGAALDAQRQLREKEGPVYDRWKAGVERARGQA